MKLYCPPMLDDVRPRGIDPLHDLGTFLLSQTGHFCATRFADLLRPFDLRPRQFAVLTCLSTTDGQSQQQLADTLGVHRNAMVRLVDDLEALGLVERHRHPDDRRAHSVRLTKLGRRTWTKSQRATAALEVEVIGGLSPDEQSQLIALLQRVSANVGLITGIHPSLNE
jgi:DNA-binding MarR family transcriptional regulator